MGAFEAILTDRRYHGHFPLAPDSISARSLAPESGVQLAGRGFQWNNEPGEHISRMGWRNILCGGRYRRPALVLEPAV